MSKKIFTILFAVIITGLTCDLKAQIITTMAGTGTAGYGGDGDLAAYAQIGEPSALAVDKVGNVFICDRANNRIRKIDIYGTMSTFAGTGIQGMSGDGGPASSAKLFGPCGIALDDFGNMFVADAKNNRIRKIDTAGTISTIIGSGVAGFGGDDSSASHARLNNPNSVALDKDGNIYIADTYNNRVRKVNQAGIITTIAGKEGVNSFSGDNGPATNANMNFPQAVAVDKAGNVFIADTHNFRVRKVNAVTGVITTVAGNSQAGYGGDQGVPYKSVINVPTDIIFDHKGNLYIADYSNQRVRKLDTNGIISTVSGNGIMAYKGDNGPAADAELVLPRSVAVDTGDNLYIGEGSGRLRFVYQSELREDSLTIFPNPCHESTQLFLYSKYEELADIQIFNSSGRMIHTSRGPTNRYIDLKLKEAGFYMVYAVAKHSRWRGKVVNMP